MRQENLNGKIIVETKNKYTQPNIFNYINAGLGFGIIINILIIPLLIYNTTFIKYINVIDLPVSISIFIFYALYKRLALNGLIPAYFRAYAKIDYILATAFSVISFSCFFRILFFSFVKLFEKIAETAHSTYEFTFEQIYFSNIINPFVFVITTLGFWMFIIYLFYFKKQWSIGQEVETEELDSLKQKKTDYDLEREERIRIRREEILEEARRQKELKKKYAAINAAASSVNNSSENNDVVVKTHNLNDKPYLQEKETVSVPYQRRNRGVIRRGRD
jgi:hypothetical protein